MTTFHERIHALAKEQGKRIVDDKVVEDDLKIKSMTLVDGKGNVRTITDPESSASRLFIEAQVMRCCGGARVASLQTERGDSIIAAGKLYYGPEYWDDEPNSGKHPTIDALRSGERIHITWKG